MVKKKNLEKTAFMYRMELIWEFFLIRKEISKEKIKILIEGNSDDHYKNVDESFKIAEKLDKDKYEIYYLSYQGGAKSWYRVDKFLQRVPHDEVGKIYQSCDILLKTSYFGKLFVSTIRMMAAGGLAVVSDQMEEIIEYLRDEKIV